MLRAMSHRVLLVEDETDIVSPLVQTLAREGYAVDQASTGRDAIAAAERALHLDADDAELADLLERLRAELPRVLPAA